MMDEVEGTTTEKLNRRRMNECKGNEVKEVEKERNLYEAKHGTNMEESKVKKDEKHT